MNNTKLRIISAAVMIIIVIIALSFKQEYALILVGLAGAIVVDEISVNFAKLERKSAPYLFSILSFISGYIFFNFIEFQPYYQIHFVNGALAINALLLYNLFLGRNSKNALLTQVLKALSYILGFLVLVVFMNLSNIIHHTSWQKLIGLLLILNFSVDTFAWFVGKKIGKRKLMPSVSPNKTVEGLIGGIVASGLLGYLFWWMFFGLPNLTIFLSLFMISLTSQLGDLLQSKLKRQCNIKDSSQLIPGHGGVYDRLDSLVFVAPLFLLLVIKNLS